VKRILFLNDWGSNPNERIFYIADYFYGLKYNVTVAGRYYKDIPKRDYFFPVYGKDTRLTRLIRNYIRFKLLLIGMKLFLTQKPSYLYIRSDYFAFYFGLLTFLTKTKLIYETHGMTYKELTYSNASKLKIIIRKNIEYIIIKYLADAIVVNSAVCHYISIKLEEKKKSHIGQENLTSLYKEMDKEQNK